MINTPEGLIRPTIELSDQDGSAGSILGRVRRALRKAGNDKDVLDAFTAEATSGDYDHLLQTAMAYAEVE